MRHENIVEVVAFGLGDADNPPCLVSSDVTNNTREVAAPYLCLRATAREREGKERSQIFGRKTRANISTRFFEKGLRVVYVRKNIVFKIARLGR